MSFIKYRFATCYMNPHNNNSTECLVGFDNVSDLLAHRLIFSDLHRHQVTTHHLYYNITPKFMLNRQLKRDSCGDFDCDMKIYELDESKWD